MLVELAEIRQARGFGNTKDIAQVFVLTSSERSLEVSTWASYVVDRSRVNSCLHYLFQGDIEYFKNFVRRV